MKRFSFHGVFILSLSAAILLASFSSQASAHQAPESLDVIVIMDESGSMASYVTALQQLADAMAQAMAASSNSRLGLIGYGAIQGHANLTNAGEAHLHLDLTSDLSQLKPSTGDLIALGTGGSAFEALTLALQRLSGAKSQNGCIVLITDHSPGAGATPESVSQSLNQAHAKLIEVLGLTDLAQALQLAKGHGSAQDFPLLAGASQLFNINLMLQDAAAFYQQVLQSCNQTGQAVTSNLLGLEAADDSTLQGISLLSPTFERLQSQIEIDQVLLHNLQNSPQTQSAGQGAGSERVEKILQEHAAKIDLLEQNLQSLAPRLVNVPSLGELKTLIQQQSDATTALGTSISDLQNTTATLGTSIAGLDQRLSAVEELTGRVTALEESSQVSSQQQSEADVQIKNISASISQINQQLTAFQSNLAALPLDELKTQLDEITSQVASNQDDLKTLTSQFNDLQNNLNALNQRQSQQADKQSAVMGAIGNQLGTLAALVKDLPVPAIDSRLKALEADVKVIPQQQDGLARLGDSLNQLQNQTTAIQTAVAGLPIADLSAKLSDLSNGIHALSSHLDQAQSESQAESQRLTDTLKAQANQEQAVDGKLASQIAANQKQSAQADLALGADIKSLANRTTAVEKRADSQENSTTSQQKSIQDQEQKIQEISSQLDELQKAIASNASDIKQLTTQLQQENDQQDANTKELAATTQATLQAQRDTFTSGIADAKQRLDAVTAAVQAISSQMSQLHDLDAQDQQLKLDFGQLQNRVEAVDKSLDALNAIFSGLNDETKKNIVDLLQKRFSEMDHEIDVLHQYMFALGAGLLASALGIVFLLLQ